MRNNHPEEINTECLLLNKQPCGFISHSPCEKHPATLGSQNLLQKRQLNVWGIRLRDAEQSPPVNQHLSCSACLVTHSTCPAVVPYRRFLCQSQPMNCTLGMQEGISTTFCKSLKDSTHSTSAHTQQIQMKQAEIQVLG